LVLRAFSGKVESGFPSENATLQNARAVSASGYAKPLLCLADSLAPRHPQNVLERSQFHMGIQRLIVKTAGRPGSPARAGEFRRHDPGLGASSGSTTTAPRTTS
jgi:hypothetical protein